MTIEIERLASLIEFAQQSARLRKPPVSTITQHGQFALYEHQLQGLPGIRLNVEQAAAEDEIWLAVDRLHETKPPEVTSPLLRPWIEIIPEPSSEPSIKRATAGACLIEAGTHCSSRTPNRSIEVEALPSVDPTELVALENYDKAFAVKAEFRLYIEKAWKPWSEEEKQRRRTIQIYSQLFTLKQQLESGIVEAQLELAWGIGFGIWNYNGTTVSYPLITRLVELTLNQQTAALEIRPRDIDARLEVDWYASVDNPDVAGLERAAKEFFARSANTFSPFDRETFEELLRAAATHLDPQGICWPNQIPPENRLLPKLQEKLVVTDTWVLFARPRTNSIFLRDLENLRKAVNSAAGRESLPAAVAAVVTDPASDNAVVELPEFRGISASYQGDDSKSPSGNKSEIRDLYFPKPFNDEQVRLVQLLEVFDGVVVQGPPGTGKSHTIANVICHYLANGHRVLVTSMKEPALAVLQEQLPSEIRPLAISLLTSEQEGMKQFEYAIQKIASEVQGLDRAATARAINQLEETVDALHGKLAGIDRKVSEWAKKNLQRIRLDGEEIDPQDAAREVVEQAGNFEWIPDALGVSPEFQPQFSDAEVIRLREARQALRTDIDYLGSSLPQMVEFPETKELLQVHQDLSRFAVLTEEAKSGRLPALADSSKETLVAAQEILLLIESLRSLRSEVPEAGASWTVTIRQRLRDRKDLYLIGKLESLGTGLERCMVIRETLLSRPVVSPPRMETDEKLLDAVSNLARGESAFGLLGLLGKSEQKKKLRTFQVMGHSPVTQDDWVHVSRHLFLLKSLRGLAARWNALALKLGLDPVAGTGPDDGIAAAQYYAVYSKVRDVAAIEQRLCDGAPKLFPSWPNARDVADNESCLSELEGALRHHLTKNRLVEVWTVKERFQRILDGRGGRVADSIRTFLANTLGNPAIDDSEMQAAWSSLMAELVRANGLASYLQTVQEVCDLIDASGAREYSQLLRQPLRGTIDSLLPDNCRQAWRLRRLATHLEAIDVQEELKRLSEVRGEIEADLSRSYRDLVVKRTWLKLVEKASPGIRAALQAYLNAIQKIGKGTGKRAVRYRQDARNAAAQANPAVPCWIMPHYRVPESLPSELGYVDLVIIDEASQSDLTALPALLRGKKVLIVGDDKQVSPEGVGLEEEKVRSLMNRFLGNQVVTYRPQMSPERSIYDLYKVVFARSGVMLKEHFRCVGPIIEFSKREFYNHELRPLRLPHISERLDPPLIDVVVEDGYRRGDLNLAEVRFIVDEIMAIVSDPAMQHRSIGVVSLLGDKQAFAAWERLREELGPEIMLRHRIECGDARTFQGKERDIMFLTMVSAPNNIGAPLARDTFAQRFNVAASRARDRMYLVRSVEPEHLSPADKLRRSLIAHFSAPFVQDETRVQDLRQQCESPFERELYDELTQRGFWVVPQVKVGQYRIDLVIEGQNDARLAVECDGDRYHGPEKWTDDMQRQRVLERAGWLFWRCFASSFIRRRNAVLDDLFRTLAEHGMEPIAGEAAPRSVHTEQRRVKTELPALSP
jgi:very-short-patch-repair endonuclease